jgi:TRAP-type C4-dicarboxylate transport system permease large subunit
VSYELIALLMFSSMMVLLLTGQRVFAAIGFVATAFALALWGDGASEMPFNASFSLLNWYPLLTLPLFIYMGYMLSESGIANDLYRMFHVWAGPVRGGLAMGTIGLMVVISAMNGLSVAGMAIGASIALPELLRRGYDKIMVTGVIQAGSSLGILIPPSVVLVLYGMIARQSIGQLWLAGALPGLLLASLFIAYSGLCLFDGGWRRLQVEVPGLSDQVVAERAMLVLAGQPETFGFINPARGDQDVIGP